MKVSSQTKKEISRWKAHINIWKLNWYDLTLTDVFLNQKRMMPSLRCVHIHSLLIDICGCQNVSVKLLCVYVCLSSGDFFIFLVRVSSFYSYFYVIPTSILSHIDKFNYMRHGLRRMSPNWPLLWKYSR